MNTYDKEKLGSNSSQLSTSKSLLSTVNTGFGESNVQEDIYHDINYSVSESDHDDSILGNLLTGFGESNKVHIEIHKPELKVNELKIHLCNGECELPEDPVFIPTVVITKPCDHVSHKDSVLESIDTGFGGEQVIVADCKKPKYKTHLCVEEYLGEFKTDSDKSKARSNLCVYSKEETNSLIIKHTSNYVSKIEVESMLSDLDYVNSRYKTVVKYEIPNDLFK